MPTPLGIGGCPTFAKAYVGQKRWAKPNNCFLCTEHQFHTSSSRSAHSCHNPVPKGRLKIKLVQIRSEKRFGSAAALYGTIALSLSSRAKPRDLQFIQPAATVAWKRYPFLVIPTGAKRSGGTCGSTGPIVERKRSRPVPPAPARPGACRRGICRSADLSWKTECVTSHRVKARRAVTRHQSSPEGLGDRREADPSAVGAALFPLLPQPDLGIHRRSTTMSNESRNRTDQSANLDSSG